MKMIACGVCPMITSDNEENNLIWLQQKILGRLYHQMSKTKMYSDRSKLSCMQRDEVFGCRPLLQPVQKVRKTFPI